MSTNDPLANVLSMIQTYDSLGKKEMLTKNNSKVIRKILEIMQMHGYIGSYEEVPTSSHKCLKVNLIGNINKAGVIKPQFHVAVKELEKFEKRYLPARDFGIIIISTNKGVITLNEAKKQSVGGKLLTYCY